MAGIEKVCEFSGEYPGWAMYGYKHDHIQIMPKYRKLFRGAHAVLQVYRPELCHVYRGGGYSTFSRADYSRLRAQWPEYALSSFEEYIKSNYPGTRPLLQHAYVLKVTDPNLFGEVEGEYVNFTFDLKSTVKRLKRMLRCRTLKIVHHDKFIYERK